MFRGLLPRKAICTCNNNVTALHLTAVSEFLYLSEKRNRKDWVQQNKFMFLAAVSGQGNCKSQQRVQKRSHHTTLRRANNMNTLYQNIRIVPQLFLELQSQIIYSYSPMHVLAWNIFFFKQKPTTQDVWINVCKFILTIFIILKKFNSSIR